MEKTKDGASISLKLQDGRGVHRARVCGVRAAVAPLALLQSCQNGMRLWCGCR